MSINIKLARLLLFFCFSFVLLGCNKNTFVDRANLINFETITFTDLNNQYLICPPDHCLKIVSDNKSPNYKLPVSSLKKLFKEILSEQPRMRLILEQNDQIQYIQRSRVFGFPDLIDIKFLAKEENTALAIFSRSIYGYYDFGINKKRVNILLSDVRLKEFIIKE